MDNYGLDMHCTMILEEYRDTRHIYEKMLDIVKQALVDGLEEMGVYVNAIEARVKTEKSLVGKLELKGSKYNMLSDMTDILGARIITFYTDDVDKVAAMADRIFDIDWENSVDKRKMHELDSFGYNSLHYICRIPKKLYYDPACPDINELRFELQMRTALQHVWAVINHDTGYKTGVEVPQEYLRNLNRLAGMMELADEQFSIIRTGINDYRRKVQNLVADGKFEEVPLDGDSFKSYLDLKPFDKLAKRIAAINQAEIHESSPMPYLSVLKDFGLKTLKDLVDFVGENTEDAYQFAVFQISNTDIDIISSTVAIQDLCIVHILKRGGGVEKLKFMFDELGVSSEYNRQRAERIVATANQLSFMHK